MSDPPGGTAAANRASWNSWSPDYQATHDPLIGREPKLWGMFALSDGTLGAIGDTAGLDVLEFGCGAAQWGASLEAEGARVVGLDLSEVQLAAARRRTRMPLVQADGEMLPFKPGSFDLVFCDHGAMSWANPNHTVPGAARVLRPGGRLVFNVTSPFLHCAYDEAGDRLGRTLEVSYFDTFAVLQDPSGATSFQLTYGAWIRLLRAHGLAIEDLIEPRPPEGATSTYLTTEPDDWARRWPAEMLWVARKA